MSDAGGRQQHPALLLIGLSGFVSRAGRIFKAKGDVGDFLRPLGIVLTK
jgi:hypothetical protein